MENRYDGDKPIRKLSDEQKCRWIHDHSTRDCSGNNQCGMRVRAGWHHESTCVNSFGRIDKAIGRLPGKGSIGRRSPPRDDECHNQQ
jgi:hypothetical protein